MMRRFSTATGPYDTSPRTTINLHRSVAMSSCVAVTTSWDMADAMPSASVHLPAEPNPCAQQKQRGKSGKSAMTVFESIS